MELHAYEPRMLRQLDDLNKSSVLRLSGNLHAALLNLSDEGVVDLIAVAVALDDLVLSVELADHGARNQAADLSAEAHGAAQVRLLAALLDIALLVGPLGDEGDDWILGVLLELSRVGARHAGLVASILNDGALHAEADAEIGNAVLPRVLGGEDLAFNAARAEAARNQDCVEILELVGSVVLECLG